jgi:hypothetical protein
MTIALCIIALTGAPCPAHGGHATTGGVLTYQRGGHAIPRHPLAQGRVGRVRDWLCIHGHEGAWNDTGDPYWGGLQMDRGFMRAYGRDMLQRHHGGLADTWTPREQMIVAERARRSRGYTPWPATARMCGLL